MNPTHTHSKSQRRRIVGAVALSIWAVSVLVPLTYLMAGHLLSLPTPTTAEVALHSDAGAAAVAPTWRVTHVLSAACGCSTRILDRLLARRALPDVSERVVYVAASDEEAARVTAAGFSFERIDEATLVARYHVEAVPLLIIAAPGGDVRYVGGYTERKRGADIRDVAILQALIRGQAPVPLPAFGCAASQALRAKIDPFGIRN